MPAARWRRLVKVPRLTLRKLAQNSTAGRVVAGGSEDDDEEGGGGGVVSACCSYRHESRSPNARIRWSLNGQLNRRRDRTLRMTPPKESIAFRPVLVALGFDITDSTATRSH